MKIEEKGKRRARSQRGLKKVAHTRSVHMANPISDIGKKGPTTNAPWNQNLESKLVSYTVIVLILQFLNSTISFKKLDHSIRCYILHDAETLILDCFVLKTAREFPNLRD